MCWREGGREGHGGEARERGLEGREMGEELSLAYPACLSVLSVLPRRVWRNSSLQIKAMYS